MHTKELFLRSSLKDAPETQRVPVTRPPPPITHLFIEGLHDIIPVMTDLPPVTAVARDPKDDIVIATALKARASYIITRDDDLLSLRQYEGITMISPEAFMGLLREQGRVR